MSDHNCMPMSQWLRCTWPLCHVCSICTWLYTFITKGMQLPQHSIWASILANPKNTCVAHGNLCDMFGLVNFSYSELASLLSTLAITLVSLLNTYLSSIHCCLSLQKNEASTLIAGVRHKTEEKIDEAVRWVVIISLSFIHSSKLVVAFYAGTEKRASVV